MRAQQPLPRPAAEARWTTATPDAMVDLAARRAKLGGRDGLAAVATLLSLHERAQAGRARRRLETLSDEPGAVGDAARYAAASIDPVLAHGAPPGLVTRVSVLGPFHDPSGRVRERDLDEADPKAWADAARSHRWGVFDVRWRPVLDGVTARGVPLDLYLHPRKESCSYVASRVTTDAGPVVISAAATGAVRVIWDGQEVVTSEELHPAAVFDRVAGRVDATRGDHLVALRVCSGALPDAGRARMRLSRPDGAPLSFSSSPDLAPLAGVTFAKITPRVEVSPAVAARELPKAPTASDRLSAAILRVQGGLDDLRSAKAPGLLDAVASDPSATADTLAMAAWIAPFGAVRSGLFGKALGLARDTGDAATASFALRRTIASRLLGGYADWAMAGLSQPPLAAESDAEAALLRAKVRAALGGDAGRRAALTELLAVVDKERDRAPTALWDEVADLSSSFDLTIELRARDELAKLLPERFDLARVRAATAVSGDAVVDAGRAALGRGGLTRAGDLHAFAAALTAAGKEREALELLRVAAKIAPNVGAVQLALSRALFASDASRDHDEAVASLDRARELEPGDARLRAEVALRARGKERPKLRDERYIVDADVLLAKVKKEPAKKGEVVDRQPYWLRAVTQHDDRRVSQLIQYAREIVIPPRTQEELYEPIPMEGDETEIVRARVHKRDGSIVFAEEQKSDQGRPMIRWPKLEEGDVVEVIVRSWTSHPIGRRGDPPFYFLDYGGSVGTHPLLYNEVVLDLPKTGALAVDVLNGSQHKSDQRDDGDRRVTRFIWDSPVVLPEEPLMPKASEVFPTLVVSSFASWDEFRAWYAGAVAGFTEPDEQIKQLARELTKGKKNEDERIRALFEFVADDIRYVNYVSGEWWLPNRPQELLARRQGDCDDKAMLLISLLKTQGLKPTEVLIQTRHTAQQKLLSSKKAAIPLFDHGIAYLPERPGHPAMWLDATSPQSRIGPIPSMDARTLALFATEGPAEMVKTPRGRPDDYGSDARWDIELDASGASVLKAEETHRGDHAFYLRTALREKDARSQWVEQNLVAGWIPEVEVDKAVEFAPDLKDGAARVRFVAKSGAFARREGEDLVVKLAPSSTLTATYAALPRRVHPVVLPPHLAPSHSRHVVHLLAPDGMVPGDLPAGGDADGGAFGRAKLEVTLDPTNPRRVALTRTVTFDADVIPPEKYGEFRAWLSSVDTLLHRSIRFVPSARGSR